MLPEAEKRHGSEGFGIVIQNQIINILSLSLSDNIYLNSDYVNNFLYSRRIIVHALLLSILSGYHVLKLLLPINPPLS